MTLTIIGTILLIAWLWMWIVDYKTFSTEQEKRAFINGTVNTSWCLICIVTVVIGIIGLI